MPSIWISLFKLTSHADFIQHETDGMDSNDIHTTFILFPSQCDSWPFEKEKHRLGYWILNFESGAHKINEYTAYTPLTLSMNTFIILIEVEQKTDIQKKQELENTIEHKTRSDRERKRGRESMRGIWTHTNLRPYQHRTKFCVEQYSFLHRTDRSHNIIEQNWACNWHRNFTNKIPLFDSYNCNVFGCKQ